MREKRWERYKHTLHCRGVMRIRPFKDMVSMRWRPKEQRVRFGGWSASSGDVISQFQPWCLSAWSVAASVVLEHNCLSPTGQQLECTSSDSRLAPIRGLNSVGVCVCLHYLSFPPPLFCATKLHYIHTHSKRQQSHSIILALNFQRQKNKIKGWKCEKWMCLKIYTLLFFY